MSNPGMSILKIDLKNPISCREIDRLTTILVNAKGHDFLIVDYGEHDFESLDVIKYCRDQLQSIESYLLKFKKIAMIHPPQFINESNDPEILNYFTTEYEAEEWFLI